MHPKQAIKNSKNKNDLQEKDEISVPRDDTPFSIQGKLISFYNRRACSGVVKIDDDGAGGPLDGAES